MTEAEIRSLVVSTAIGWMGKSEMDGSFKPIIDLYNTLRPLPRGYKVQYTDEWCATFVSAVAAHTNLTDIMPTGCGSMIKLYKSHPDSKWIENDSYAPQPGDVIFYDWNDTGVGDTTGSPEHVGIVEKVAGGVITVIEGNKGRAVARRTLKVNGRYIRGYGLPAYWKHAEPDKISEYKEIIKQHLKVDDYDTIWRLNDAHPYPEAWYRKWSESYK